MIVFRNAAKLKKIMNMGRRQKLQIAGITVMMLIGACLETLGVSMVVPIIWWIGTQKTIFYIYTRLEVSNI